MYKSNPSPTLRLVSFMCDTLVWSTSWDEFQPSQPLEFLRGSCWAVCILVSVNYFSLRSCGYIDIVWCNSTEWTHSNIKHLSLLIVLKYAQEHTWCCWDKNIYACRILRTCRVCKCVVGIIWGPYVMSFVDPLFATVFSLKIWPVTCIHPISADWSVRSECASFLCESNLWRWTMKNKNKMAACSLKVATWCIDSAYMLRYLSTVC
jgi:hypothetical protein